MKKLFFILFLITLAGFGWLYHQSQQFLNYRSPYRISLSFDKGTSVRKITQILERNHVVPNAMMFEALVRLHKQTPLIKAGEYLFKQGLTPDQVLAVITSGKVKLYPLTIPEGYNLKQIGALLIKKKLTTQTRWQNLTRQTHLIEDLAPNAQTLEGYLFPDTYLLEKTTTADQLIKQMVHLTKTKLASLDQNKLPNLKLHEWVTLASIIEKETGLGSERPLIASVFLNRLQKNMLLQTDPTVIYGIRNFNGNLTRRHLKTDHPYNTYTRSGLPPGPIASPGLDSLKAVLEPATTPYLYFVAKGGGAHYFSTHLKQHNHAVRYYQLKKGPPPPKESSF